MRHDLSNMKPNVILLCLDSVRKDDFDTHMSSTLEMATEEYDQMRAASSWSVPSHASMLTGKIPSESGVHSGNQNFDTIDS